MVGVRIEHCPADDTRLTGLLVAAVAELNRRYPDYVGEHPLDPRTEFLIALVADQPAGCVGMFPVNGRVAEMKRLYVAPGYRGSGVARGLIGQLELRAMTAGFANLRLETGIRQPEAISLYTTLGYEPTPSYDGEYESNSVSRYFNKRLW